MQDIRLLELLPHRPPMLLLSELLSVTNEHAEAEVLINSASSFFIPDKGVPNWVGLEYVGQTAALIAGLQLQEGSVAAHVGFLLGARKYSASCSFFQEGKRLRVSCQQAALVGDSLATFVGQIFDAQNGDELASTRLSVFRKFTDVEQSQVENRV